MRATLMTTAMLALAGCAMERTVEPLPAVYSSASPYAAGSPYATSAPYAAGTPQVISPVPGSYCAEAVEEAQDAAATAAMTGSPRDDGRAARTAQYAARDCR